MSTPRRSQFFRLLPLAVLLAVGACSLAGFTYDLAPRFAVRFVDDFLQLTNRQEAEALALFRERHAQHARDELPRYYEFLLETDAAFADGIEPAEVDAVFDGVSELYRLGVARTVPAVAEILAGLDEAQVDALDERLAEEAAEDREEMAEDQRAERLRDVLDDAKEWIGPLRDEQRRLITRAVNAMEETRPLWLAWRIERNERLVELLREGAAKEEIEAFLLDYWVERSGMPEELTAKLDANRERFRAMIVALDATLDREQRNTARDRIAEYTETVLDIMPDEIRLAVLEREAGGPRPQ